MNGTDFIINENGRSSKSIEAGFEWPVQLNSSYQKADQKKRGVWKWKKEGPKQHIRAHESGRFNNEVVVGHTYDYKIYSHHLLKFCKNSKVGGPIFDWQIISLSEFY